jgi:ferric-dicitrate binding protein FerR (iron transport regulator)
MEDCPFIVHSDNVTTTVLGTSFNVKAYPAKMEYQVAVVTGKVLVAAAKNNSLFSKKDETILLPNQQAEISGENFQLKVTNVEIEKVSGWKNGVLVLDQLSIEGIADKLEQWYGLPVKINDEEIRNITFVGRFKNPTLEDVLESIKYTVNINYKIYGSYVLLERVKDKKERN